MELWPRTLTLHPVLLQKPPSVPGMWVWYVTHYWLEADNQASVVTAAAHPALSPVTAALTRITSAPASSRTIAAVKRGCCLQPREFNMLFLSPTLLLTPHNLVGVYWKHASAKKKCYLMSKSSSFVFFLSYVKTNGILLINFFIIVYISYHVIPKPSVELLGLWGWNWIPVILLVMPPPPLLVHPCTASSM